MNDMTVPFIMDEADKAIVRATQGGLPLVSRPYEAVAKQLGLPHGEVIDRLRRMLDAGVVRRVGVIPNHYALGYKANGMTVWDVRDADVGTLGARVGALPFVSHCYCRPRHLPGWTYNLFAMVHGRTRDDVAGQISEIADLLGESCRKHEVLYSTRILKKTGLRLAA